MGTGYSVAGLQGCSEESARVSSPVDVAGEATQLQEVNNYIIVCKLPRDATIGTASRLPHILPWGAPEPGPEEGSDSQEEAGNRESQEGSDFVDIPSQNSSQEAVESECLPTEPKLQGTGKDCLLPERVMASQDPINETEDIEERNESPQPEVTPVDHEGLVWEISFSSSSDEQKPWRSIPKFLLRERERPKTQTPRTDQLKKDLTPAKPPATKSSRLSFKSPPFRAKVTPEKKGSRNKSPAVPSASPQSAKSPEARSSTTQKPKKSLMTRLSPQKSTKADKKRPSPQSPLSEKDKPPKTRPSSAGKPSPEAKSPRRSPRTSLASLRSSSSLLPNQLTFSGSPKHKKERKGAKEWVAEARSRAEQSTSSEKMDEESSEEREDKTEASQPGSSGTVWEIDLSDTKPKNKPAGVLDL